MPSLYKVIASELWKQAQEAGVFSGAEIDLTDGFIHLSSSEQVEETVAKHFAGQTDLLLLNVDALALGATLRWEPSRGGALFQHVYGDIPLGAVTNVSPLPLDDNGKHIFPADL